LITQGFDEEQIWQQVELQNENVLTNLFVGVSKVLTNRQLTIPVSFIESKHEPVETTDDELSQEDDDISDDIFNDIPEDISEDENELKTNLKKGKIKQKKKSSVVDDKFFKLGELDEYLNKEERGKKRNNLESDDESIDLFNDFSEAEDEDTENKHLKYTDFFDNPESENEQYEENESLGDDIDNFDEEDLKNEDEMDDDEQVEKEQKNKKVRFNLTNDSDSLDIKVDQEKQYISENKEEDIKEDIEPKSNLELRQERLQQRIKELEEETIKEKPWQLKGEVSGLNRPQNSLLEEFVEYDITTRPAPVITEQTTIKLEDIIKQRIKDKTWDDVEKKFKPIQTPLEYKKKLILNQEKSKESLSQIYEKEYLKQKQALNPEGNQEKEEMPKAHKKILKEMNLLMSKLDALCNYHFTPKRVRFTLKFGFKIYIMILRIIYIMIFRNMRTLMSKDIYHEIIVYDLYSCFRVIPRLKLLVMCLPLLWKK